MQFNFNKHIYLKHFVHCPNTYHKVIGFSKKHEALKMVALDLLASQHVAKPNNINLKA